MKAAEVRAALARKYALPEYALFYEVGDGTGAGSRRWADAVAMSLWPSRGLELAGFEIKVARSDWLHELRQPQKSMPVQQYMDRWWVVTPPDIVKEGELPPTWGHLIVTGSGLRQAVAAPKLDKLPTAPAFLAALLRRSAEHAAASVKGAVDDAMRDEREAMAAKIEDKVKRELELRRSAAEQATADLGKIKAACGFDPKEYVDAAHLGRAIGFVYRAGPMSAYGGIRAMADQAAKFVETVNTHLPERCAKCLDTGYDSARGKICTCPTGMAAAA
ncbi:hypothetical protein [Sphingomonas leidyi]|uniref:hypothetical protein n=1 Tax=Sphingomonas leidyi TaxID=68569 RepID=UPI0036D31583